MSARISAQLDLAEADSFLEHAEDTLESLRDYLAYAAQSIENATYRPNEAREVLEHLGRAGAELAKLRQWVSGGCQEE